MYCKKKCEQKTYEITLSMIVLISKHYNDRKNKFKAIKLIENGASKNL